MSGQANNRAGRRNRAAKKVFATAGAAVTTVALTAGIAPPAAHAAVYNPAINLVADPIEFTTISTGPLMGLLSALGVKTIPLTVGGVTANFNLNWTESNPQNVYNALNALPLATTPVSPLVPCGNANSASCRITPLYATGFGVFGARDALNALWTAGTAAGSNGVDPYAGSFNPGNVLDPGYSLLQGLDPVVQYPSSPPGPTLESSTTDVVSILINDPLRINGGFAARFAPLFNLLGIDTSFPVTGVTSNCSSGATCPQYVTAAGEAPTDSYLYLQSNVIDLTWAYNPFADFPATANPFSLVNSLFAALPPTYLLTAPLTQFFSNANYGGGINLVYAPPGKVAIGGQLQYYFSGSTTPMNLGTSPLTFVTLKNDDLPILSPLRLPSLLINTLLSKIGSPYLVGTPIADMLQPALKILVNLGYSDVVTPTDIANDPTLLAKGYCGLGGVCYDRTFAQTTTTSNTFGLLSTLTPQEMLKVPGDVINALVAGIGQQLQKPFFGILEPNQATPAATPAAVSAAAPAAVSAPAAQSVAAVSAPAKPATRAKASTARAAAHSSPAAAGASSGKSASRGLAHSR